MKDIRDWTIVFTHEGKSYEACVLAFINESEDDAMGVIRISERWDLVDNEIYDLGAQKSIKESDISDALLDSLKKAIEEHEED